MNAPNTIKDILTLPVVEMGRGTAKVKKLFRWINYSILLVGALFISYFLFASDRYVSDATIIIQNTDQVASSGLDLGAIMFSKMGGVSIPDQLLLKEHLLSIDMLQKLDKELDLRSHYSDSSHDIVSRMWFKDASMEWFHRHFLARVKVEYDEFAGVLRINTQAYSAKMANAITASLVAEGEKFMNEMSHELARTQVKFLESQVESAQAGVKEARDELLAFQNNKGLVSPKDTVESIHKIVGGLEGQRTKIQTQIDALPPSLAKNHPTRRSLQQALLAVEKQIRAEEKKMASTSGRPINALMVEQQRLEQEVVMKQDVYKNALICLEKGRMDAARTLKIVSVIQAPSHPEYAWQPRRIYGIIATIILVGLVLGIANLLKSIVLDHVD